MSGSDYNKEIARLNREIRRAKTQRDAAQRAGNDAAFKSASHTISELVPQMRDLEIKRDRYAD